MNVPVLRIPFSEDDKKFIHLGLDEILDSGFLTMGTYTRRLEEMFAEFIGVHNAISCSSGLAPSEYSMIVAAGETAQICNPAEKCSGPPQRCGAKRI